MSASAIYAGLVTHERTRPKRHRSRYRMFQLLIDLNELEGLHHRLRFFSRNRFNILSFHDRDYGDRSATPLRDQIEAHLCKAGLEADGGPIRLLTQPRMLGYVFNPLTTWFCHRIDGSLMAIIYEITNSFQDRHFYVIPVRAEGFGNLVRQQAEKKLYVSPFMDMAMHYHFTVRRPREDVLVAIEGSEAEGPIINAIFAGRRRALSDAGILRACIGHPLQTLRVTAGIHWQALRLRAKRLPVRPHPTPPEEQVTLGR